MVENFMKNGFVRMYHFNPHDGTVIPCEGGLQRVDLRMQPNCLFIRYGIKHYDTVEEAARGYQLFKDSYAVSEDEMQAFHKQEYDLEMDIHAKRNAITRLNNDWSWIKGKLNEANLPEGIVTVDESLFKDTEQRLSDDYEAALKELRVLRSENPQILNALTRDRIMDGFDTVVSRLAENRPRVEISVSKVGP